MSIELDKHDQDIVDKHGFVVTTEGDRFVVTDPKLSKKNRRYVGGNLAVLLLRAVQKREEFEQGTTSESNVVHRSFQPAKPMKRGKIYYIKVAVLENPDITNEAVIAKLKEIGLVTSLSVVSQVKADLISTMKLLNDLGILKGRTDGEDKGEE